MKITEDIVKTKKLVNHILIESPEKLDIEKLNKQTIYLCKKRNIHLPASEIEKVVNDVLAEFYDIGLITGDEKRGFYLNFPNHRFEQKGYDKNIENLSNRRFQF